MVLVFMVSLNILDVLSKQSKLLLRADKLCTFKAENDSLFSQKGGCPHLRLLYSRDRRFPRQRSFQYHRTATTCCDDIREM